MWVAGPGLEPTSRTIADRRAAACGPYDPGPLLRQCQVLEDGAVNGGAASTGGVAAADETVEAGLELPEFVELATHLREVNAPLKAAGPVRGEDYDTGRFRLRQLCCSGCGMLVDVQVALDGAPRPFFRIENWPAPTAHR